MEKEPHEVAAMFDGVAEKYDRTNTVLALGQDRMWRRRTREALNLRPGEKVLDLAAGTGVSTAELARSGAYAVGADFSVGMLRVGQKLGWTEEGRFRLARVVDGKHYDSVVYGVLRSEWEPPPTG